jgi:predicted P-loop ATPase
MDENIVSFEEHRARAWHRDCILNDKKKILPIYANVILALRRDPDVRDVFAYDEMLRAVVMHREIPIGRVAEPCDRRAGDKDVNDLLEWLHRAGMPGVKADVARMAMHTRAHESAFHPVRDYLRSIVWDEVPRLNVWLSSYLGAELNHYNSHIGRMFLTSMVARILDPGCQVDHMIVLEGSQGILKSSACRVLGGQWFSDALPEITSNGGRDVSQHLRGKWLIEVSEMHAMSKTEATLLKSFITRQVEQYLPRYGRLEAYEPRQCVFVGTTNQDSYLKDPTGGRRFWPVKTGVSGKIELGLLAEYRDLLFAEAMHNYANGGHWWPDQALERELIAPEQRARYAADIWEDRIREYCSGLSKTTIAEIATNCLGFIDKELRQEHLVRISSILRDMGWMPKRTMHERFWYKP